ncbi:MAG: ChbG/HpnK family deacetylase, partial [Candidatus Omnitrophota bacterium]
MSKRLIINADDFGAARESNENILRCFTNGAVSDISLLAVGDAFDEAAKLAAEKGIKKLGAHLALTESFKA